MKYAKKLHEALLPHYKAYKEAVEKLVRIKAENKEKISTSDVMEREYIEHKRKFDLETAHAGVRLTHRYLLENMEKIHDELQQKFSEEIADNFAYDPEEIDPKLTMILNSDGITVLDYTKLYRNAGNATNKRLIAESAAKFRKANLKTLTPDEAQALSLIEADGSKFSPNAALANFEDLYNTYAYTSRVPRGNDTGSENACTILKTLPEYAAAIGLSMD